MPYSKEKVGDIMGDIDTNSQIGEMEPVAQSNQGQGDDVVSNELLEVLSGLLQLQQQDNRLLGPVACLKQVECLEERLMFSVRESLKHGSRVEVPDIRPAHDIETERTENAKVDCRVYLFHKPCRLAFAANSAPDRERPDQSLHQKLPSERQNNRVERDKRNILRPFSVHDRTARGLRGLRIREENGAVHRVGLCRVDQVQRQQENQHHKRQQPCVLQTNIFRATKQRTVLAALGGLGLLSGNMLLWDLLEWLVRHSNTRTCVYKCHTLSNTPGSDSTGLTRFMVDIAGALVSPRMSAPRLLDFLRGRGITG